jgi:hypothetical protein
MKNRIQTKQKKVEIYVVLDTPKGNRVSGFGNIIFS